MQEIIDHLTDKADAAWRMVEQFQASITRCQGSIHEYNRLIREYTDKYTMYTGAIRTLTIGNPPHVPSDTAARDCIGGGSLTVEFPERNT